MYVAEYLATSYMTSYLYVQMPCKIIKFPTKELLKIISKQNFSYLKISLPHKAFSPCSLKIS